MEPGTEAFIPIGELPGQTLVGCRIHWRDIATIPADRTDGRDVLIFNGRVLLCSWCDGWRDSVGRLVTGATMWADAEGPVL